METLVGSFIQELIERLVVELAAFARSYSLRTLSLVGAKTQSNRRSTVIGSMTRSYCGGRYGPRRRSAICQMRFEKYLWSGMSS